jgi:atypical dual specificity phosphatase
LNFSFVIPGRLAGLAMPGLNNPLKEETNFLQKQKVTVLLNLADMEYFYDEYRQWFQVIDEPIIEFGAPNNLQMDRIARHYSRLKENEAMGVHCAGGVGRTGTVLACLLGINQNFSGEMAISQIRKMRPGSIESKVQEIFVKDYLELRRLRRNEVIYNA